MKNQLPSLTMDIVNSDLQGRAMVMSCIGTLPVTTAIIWLFEQDIHVLAMLDAQVSVDCSSYDGAAIYALMGNDPDKLMIITQFIAELIERHLDKTGTSVYDFARDVQAKF